MLTPAVIDARPEALRAAEAGIGKVDNIFNANKGAQAQVCAWRKANGDLIKLFIKIFAVPVSFAATKKPIEERLLWAVHVDEYLELFFELQAGLVFRAVIIQCNSNSIEEIVRFTPPGMPERRYDKLEIDPIHEAQIRTKIFTHIGVAQSANPSACRCADTPCDDCYRSY